MNSDDANTGDCDCSPTVFRSSCPAHTIMRTDQFDQLHATLDVPDEAPTLTGAAQSVRDMVLAELDDLEHSDVIRQRASASYRPGRPDEDVVVTMRFTPAEWFAMQKLADTERPLATQLRETIMMEFGI